MRCLFCNNYRAKKLVVCEECKPYLVYKDEQWFKELLHADRIQRRIDSYEIPQMGYMNNASTTNGLVAFRRSVGAPGKLTRKERDFILILQEEESLSYRALHRKLVTEYGFDVSRETVRRILRRKEYVR